MRIHGLVVARNEANRYLELSLKLLKAQVDSILFYDDRSTDETTEIAEQYTQIHVRPIDSPSFLDNEGLFRQDAWNLYQRELQPSEDTWVISVDADELLLGPSLLSVCSQVGTHTAVNVPIPEVFGWQNGPLIRIDGLWPGLKAPRLFHWQSGGTYPEKPMACGSAPDYVRNQGPFLENTGVTLLHCGYLREWDRMAKYARYSAISHGHNSAHIRSILQPMTLEKWIGPYPSELAELAEHEPHVKKSSI